MFRNIEFDADLNRSTGHVNCPLFSYWGRYQGDLHDIWDGCEPVSFGDLRLPQSTIQDPFFLTVHIDGHGPSRAHIDQLLRLSERQDVLIPTIREKVAAYYDDTYVEMWKSVEADPTDSLLDNFFRPQHLVIYPDAIQVYCSSFFDEEHGLQILIVGDDVTVDMDLTHEPARIEELSDPTHPDIRRYITRGEIPKAPRLALSEDEMETIAHDSRQFYIQFSESRDAFIDRLHVFISETSNSAAYADTVDYFQSRLDEASRIDKLCPLEQSILVDLATRLGVGFRTNNIKTPLWYSWRSILKGKECSLEQMVAVLGSTYAMIMTQVEDLRCDLERGEIDDHMYQEFVKEVNKHPVDNRNICEELHRTILRSE